MGYIKHGDVPYLTVRIDWTELYQFSAGWGPRKRARVKRCLTSCFRLNWDGLLQDGAPR